jgi:hypothetical protein
MSEAKLDQVVKGAPVPESKAPLPPRPRSIRSSTTESAETQSFDASDPLSTLPSSPPQIYLNLLILEASLRSQYLTLRARRRQHTFFLLLLSGWIAFFFYALFMRPREDGKGLGGSVYWVVEMAEKVAFMGGVVTAILVWGTGQWERGIRWPRRWLGITNRGLRNVNSKLVVVKGPWYEEALSAMGFLFPYSSLFPSTESSYHYVEHVSESGQGGQAGQSKRSSQRYRDGSEELITVEEDLSPGGDYVKLLLLPKPFSPDFRENWEVYRTGYWERENERRDELRRRVKARQRVRAKQDGGVFWWTGWHNWRRPSSHNASGREAEKAGHHHHHHHQHPHHSAPSHQYSYSGHGQQHLERSTKTRSSNSYRSGSHSRTESHSRTSSRASTPTVERDERDFHRDSASPERGSLRGKPRGPKGDRG